MMTLGALGAPRSGGGGVMGKDPEQHISSNPMLHRRCTSIVGFLFLRALIEILFQDTTDVVVYILQRL